MSYHWKHTCDLAWLAKRQQYLTASDVRKLIPLTPTGRKKVIKDSDYISVMSSKMVLLDADDCVSYGAAARGHLLEPYAIEECNRILAEHKCNIHLYHWDDEIVTDGKRKLAFSPDAMSVPMHDIDPATASDLVIAEVKCYNPERHLQTAYMDKSEMEERWQIATAMAVLSNIRDAYLVLFNPKMKVRKTFVIHFSREDLKEEIEMILQVEKDWEDFIINGPLVKKPQGVYLGASGNEKTIKEEVERNQSLNP